MRDKKGILDIFFSKNTLKDTAGGVSDAWLGDGGLKTRTNQYASGKNKEPEEYRVSISSSEKLEL